MTSLQKQANKSTENRNSYIKDIRRSDIDADFYDTPLTGAERIALVIVLALYFAGLAWLAYGVTAYVMGAA